MKEVTKKIREKWKNLLKLVVERKDLDDGYFCYDLIDDDDQTCICSFCEFDYSLERRATWDAKKFAELFSNAAKDINLLCDLLEGKENETKKV